MIATIISRGDLLIPSHQTKFKNMSPTQYDFPEDGDAESIADVFGNDVRDISVWEDGGDRSRVEKVATDAIAVASSLDSYSTTPPPPRAAPASPVRPPRIPIGRRRKVLLEGPGACFSSPMRRPSYEHKSPTAAPKMKQQLVIPIITLPMTPRTKKRHLSLPPLVKRKSATEKTSSDSSVVAFPVDWGNACVVLDEFIKSRAKRHSSDSSESGDVTFTPLFPSLDDDTPEPVIKSRAKRHSSDSSESGDITCTPFFLSLDDAPEPIIKSRAKRYSSDSSESGDIIFTPFFPSLDDDAPEPISSSSVRRRSSLACPLDESSLFSDASGPSKCSPQASHSSQGSRHISASPPSMAASPRCRSSKQANITYRRPRRNSCAGEQEWSTDCTKAWPVDPSVSFSAESTATDSSSVVKQKKVAARRLFNSVFGENNKGSPRHSGPRNTGVEWSRRRRPSTASAVDVLKTAFQVRSSTSMVEGPSFRRRASSLSRKTARRSSMGNLIHQGRWPTDFAEDSQANPSGQDDRKHISPRIKAGRNIKCEKASKDGTDGEDSKSGKSSKSKASRSCSRSMRQKSASKDHIEEKKDEQVDRSERKAGRWSLRGDKGSSSRDGGENSETSAGLSDSTERDDAVMVFPCVTPMGRKPMLSVKLGRRDDKQEGVAPAWYRV